MTTPASISSGELVARLVAAFPEAAGREDEVVIVRAPGRVNLIGEHTDYNGGFVLPFAIDMDVRIALLPVREPRIRIHREDNGETATISLDPFPPKGDAWHDYIAGTAWALARHDQPIAGFDGVLVSNLPIGSGLSSSAALEVVTAWALSAPDGPAIEPLEVARIAQYAENNHVGVRCGLMDQFASACGVEGSALLFDCRSSEWRAGAAAAGAGAGGDPQWRIPWPRRQRVQRSARSLRASGGDDGRGRPHGHAPARHRHGSPRGLP